MAAKILIVDDQYGIRLLLNEVLKKEGYELFQAANGPEAIALAKQEKPDLVLLDMKIPGMNGIEILKKMKKDNEQIRAVMMTAYGELDTMREAEEAGAVHHIPKPFEIDEIRQIVREHIIK